MIFAPLSPRSASLMALLLLPMVAGCSALDRLADVGKPPALASIDDPTATAGYKPVQMPMPPVEQVSYSPNSLWRSGSRTFFKDQRARSIGDILTVKVLITDKAKFSNSTSRERTSADTAGFGGLAGDILSGPLPSGVDPTKLVSNNSDTSTKGVGSIDRSESLTTNVATIVTQILPNGNLVIEGKQEIRVNFEVRELIVAGVVRPEDIASDNTIDSAKIAEARISYGGRGQITDMQQPRYGQQVMDVILPF